MNSQSPRSAHGFWLEVLELIIDTFHAGNFVRLRGHRRLFRGALYRATQVYETALDCVLNDELRQEWAEYHTWSFLRASAR